MTFPVRQGRHHRHADLAPVREASLRSRHQGAARQHPEQFRVAETMKGGGRAGSRRPRLEKPGGRDESLSLYLGLKECVADRSDPPQGPSRTRSTDADGERNGQASATRSLHHRLDTTAFIVIDRVHRSERARTSVGRLFSADPKANGPGRMAAGFIPTLQQTSTTAFQGRLLTFQ
jgi:hypothetical protein